MFLKNNKLNLILSITKRLYFKLYRKELHVISTDQLYLLYEFLWTYKRIGIYKKRGFLVCPRINNLHRRKVTKRKKIVKFIDESRYQLYVLRAKKSVYRFFNWVWHFRKIKRKTRFNSTRNQRQQLKLPLSKLFTKRETDMQYSWFCLRLTSHRRQQYFITSNYPYWDLHVYSAGYLLSPVSRKVKYYKRSIKNLSVVLLRCRILWSIHAHFLRLLFCKNFNYKHYSWLKKFLFYVQPEIQYAVFTHSWPHSPKGLHRVKKKVYRNLLKTG